MATHAAWAHCSHHLPGVRAPQVHHTPICAHQQVNTANNIKRTQPTAGAASRATRVLPMPCVLASSDTDDTTRPHGSTDPNLAARLELRCPSHDCVRRFVVQLITLTRQHQCILSAEQRHSHTPSLEQVHHFPHALIYNNTRNDVDEVNRAGERLVRAFRLP